MPSHYLNQCWNIVNWILRTNFSEILIEIHIFSFKKMHLKMPSAYMAAILSGQNVISTWHCPCEIGWSLPLSLHGTFQCEVTIYDANIYIYIIITSVAAKLVIPAGKYSTYIPSNLKYKSHRFPYLNVSSSSCFRPIHWRHVFSREWRCSWSSADMWCSNYIWVINNVIVY